MLLRHSLLSSEDKRRVVVEANGVLDYKNTVKAVRLLGSRFFNDLQQKNVHGNQKGPDRSKVYDVKNMAEEDNNEEIFLADEEFSEEDLVTYMAEQMDEDAIYIVEFEDHIIEALQESDLAPIFTSYQEARQKLREKARSRGFWPPSKGREKKGPSFTGRKGKGFGKNGGRGRTLAERIANSHCRLRGQAGHWKRECPQRTADHKTGSTNHTFAAGASVTTRFSEVLQELPDESAPFYMDDDDDDQARSTGSEQIECSVGQPMETVITQCSELCLHVGTPKVPN